MSDFLKKPDTLGAWKRQLAFFEAVKDSRADCRASVLELIETGRICEPVRSGGAR